MVFPETVKKTTDIVRAADATRCGAVNVPMSMTDYSKGNPMSNEPIDTHATYQHTLVQQLLSKTMS